MITLLRKELLEQWRSYRLLIGVAVLLAGGILGPMTAKYLPVLLSSMAEMPEGLSALLPELDIGMAVSEYVDNVVQFGVILAVLLPMASVVAEKASGTAEIALSKPVSRAAFLVAKFLAHALTFVAGMAGAALAGYYYTGVLFSWLDLPAFLTANGLILAYLVFLVAVTLLASTLARSQLAAAGMAFGVLVALGILGSIPALGAYLPSTVVGWARGVALGGALEPQWAALAACVGLSAAALVAAWGIFRRQEI